MTLYKGIIMICIQSIDNLDFFKGFLSLKGKDLQNATNYLQIICLISVEARIWQLLTNMEKITQL